VIVLRPALLLAAKSGWLERHVVRSSAGRRAAARFMPGEGIEDALAAALELKRASIASVLTHLGEDVSELAEADAAARFYEDAFHADLALLNVRPADAYPRASEWIHQAVLAIRAEVSYEVLLDTVPQFPSYSEAFLSALQALELD